MAVVGCYSVDMRNSRYIKLALVATLAIGAGCGDDYYTVVRSSCSAIVQGDVVDYTSLPTVATGHYDLDTGEFRQTCSGTYIAPGVVLSAAHCGNVAAVERDGEIRNNILYLPHPDYEADRLANDLALIFLDGELSIDPARLGAADYGKALIQGYGLDENHVSGILREGTTDIVEFWAPDTLVTSAGADTCYGDSGGPIYQAGVLVGVTRAGKPGLTRDNACGQGGLYTLTVSHKNWLDSEVDHLNWVSACGTL